MKIKTKLLLGLSTIPILILLLIAVGFFQIANLRELSVSTEKNYQLSLLAERIQTEVKNEAISLRNIVIFNDQDIVQRELNSLQKESKTVSENIILLESMVNTEEQKVMVENLRETNQKFNDYREQVTELVSQGKRAEALELINSNADLIHNEFFKVISDLSNHFENNMKTSFTSTSQEFELQIWITSLISLLFAIIVTMYMYRTVWSIAIRLSKVSNVMKKVASGSTDLSTKVQVLSNDEIDEIGSSFNQMTQSLEHQREKEQGLTWIKSNIADITTSLSGIQDLAALSQTFLSKVVPLMNSSHAVFYCKDGDLPDDQSNFKLLSSYATQEKGIYPEIFQVGEGLMGQVVLEKSAIILTDVPSDYLRVTSGLVEAAPVNIYVIPVIFEDDVKGVIELASFKPFSLNQQIFLEETISSLGIILESLMGRIRLANLLEETQVLMEEVQAQSEELQSQQEELRVTNEELEEQTQALRESEHILQVQQEELEQTNLELKEKAEILEQQNEMFEITNKEVEKARAELEEKAKQLALSSKYKSEFLANMSHELRTPLNSLLILSKLLADNAEGNLSDKQVKYSKTIYSSGNDLLMTINDILDLAKIESGKMLVNPNKVLISELVEFAESRFRPIANEKKIGFNIVLKDHLPSSIYSDEQRLQQVLKNLLSNAFKFTHHGEVTLEISWDSQSMFSFAIIDTGIGIPKEKQELIFEAFQQADGTTNRKYGGTGLGLSICREIASLLKGKIVVESEEGKGSKFSFYVANFEGEVMPENQEYTLTIKETASTKEIVENQTEGLSSLSFPSKSKPNLIIEPNGNIKRLLIVDDDLRQRNSLMELIGEKDVIIKAVSSGKEAIEELKVNKFDCMILDLGLGDTNGFDLLEKINKTSENLYVFIYTGRDLTIREELFLKKYAHTIIIKDAHSPQRLIDELELFIKPNKDEMLINSEVEQVQTAAQAGLEGKRVLLVDDDVRNVYALMSLLEQYNMEITFAENGRECLEVLEKNIDFDLILMDIMMPEMDGYDAIRGIRELRHFDTLPIIALTAKAMKEDREKCLEAGASDYIVKPFDPDQLISLIQVWLYQKAIK
nr:response regulator [Neobacillus sp. Marseille-Q6967]